MLKNIYMLKNILSMFLLLNTPFTSCQFPGIAQGFMRYRVAHFF